MVDFCHNLGIVVTVHNPLGSGGIIHETGIRRKRDTIELPSVIQNDVVKSIAKKHNKSPAQVTLRFGLQRNLVVILKSSHPKRIRENFDVFDFTLTDSEMKQLKALDQHGRYRKFAMSTGFPGAENHPECERIILSDENV
ncbi:1,5-anhydro-D-fructose reductase-like [Nasonia vitripennis]|uniref:NADP-dependent oxidoreductase domain-containing protein n=1 Tax=Nasonia vitripennis TaxID=7425 RepID=A0A7M7QCF6_NASVI|nr:1,5-anhydro-D-fructose reductase-like [Nasonia vitripennis]